MLNDTLRRNALVPLVLRLALAAIFIFHGWDKVASRGNAGGTSWADNRWEQMHNPPPEAQAKLDKFRDNHESRAKEAKDAGDTLGTAYAEDSPTIPGSLQTAAVQLLVAWGELLCGVALLVGLATRWAAVAMVLIQIGAIATVTWAHGFSAAGGIGYEYNLLVIAACLGLALKGGGLVSLDHWLRALRARRATHATAPVQAQSATPVGV
jgi:uncharacterized membrane protein YphA (DoxX/SURF4 family)